MSRHAFPATCPRCGAPVIESEHDLAAGVGVALMRADPTTISQDVESSCVILDRPAYNLHHRRGDAHLSLRDRYTRRYKHCGPPDAILPAHSCGRPLPGTHIDITPPPPPEQVDPNQLDLTPDTIPF